MDYRRTLSDYTWPLFNKQYGYISYVTLQQNLTVPFPLPPYIEVNKSLIKPAVSKS